MTIMAMTDDNTRCNDSMPNGSLITNISILGKTFTDPAGPV